MIFTSDHFIQLAFLGVLLCFGDSFFGEFTSPLVGEMPWRTRMGLFGTFFV
jgi:hypothetical protein